MLNNTEHNNTVICVLPAGVELPTPKNYEAYCRKYAPSHTRKVGKRATVGWEADGCEHYGRCNHHDFRYEFVIYSCMHRWNMCIDELDRDGVTFGTFVVKNIPSVRDAKIWAESYVNSFIALWCDDRYEGVEIEYEWAEVRDMDKVEQDAIGHV